MGDGIWSYYLRGGAYRSFIFNVTLLAAIWFLCVAEYVSQAFLALQTNFLVPCESTSIIEWSAAETLLAITRQDHGRVAVRLLMVVVESWLFALVRYSHANHCVVAKHDDRYLQPFLWKTPALYLVDCLRNTYITTKSRYIFFAFNKASQTNSKSL